MSWNREPTPSPIDDPIDDELSGPLDWYYASDAGGMILPFAKYANQSRHMNSVGLPYLLFCQTQTRKTSFLNAFEKYYEGLREFLETGYNYEDFRVPFGAKHRGTLLRKCRDKDWLVWCSRQSFLIDKVAPRFFRWSTENNIVFI
ncbi:hypothetical protein C8R44DRAFT_11304 [Mycena epipterygia]|nr:hypothetical protein C8R44DRAFT_11304 [Mycena epipterygia]